MPPFGSGPTTKAIIDTANEREMLRIDDRDREEEKAAGDINDVLQSQLNGFQEGMGSAELLGVAANIGDDGEMEAAILALYLTVASLGVSGASAQLDTVGVTFDVGRATQNASEQVRQLTQRFSQLINENSRRNAIDIINNWTGSGRTFDDLRDELEERVFSVDRSQRIARTEGTRGFQVGFQEAATVAGVTRFEWYTMPDQHVCKICRPMQGQRRVLGGTYSASLPVQSPPPAHVDCRCGESAVVAGL